MKQVLAVFGTRPEAVKLGPVIEALSANRAFEVRTLATAQHREMLDDVLRVFRITPDYDLNIMTSNQSLAEVTSKCVLGIDRILKKEPPAVAIAQGDTTTVLCTALASYYNRVPFAHVEAGLRTRDKMSPFPEEMNRHLAGVLTDLHFAPTEKARANLLEEGISPDSIHVCGNTVVDAVQEIASRDPSDARLPKRIISFLGETRRLVLVTVHRRESFGGPMRSICEALREIVDATPDVGLILPVHPNPNVKGLVTAALANHGRILLCEPLNYLEFVHVMKRAYLILTDSGGVQEEAPSLGKPVLVLRDRTERPEGIDAGVARLVGTNGRRITEEALSLLNSDGEYANMVGQRNPYGDGRAGRRIAAQISRFLGIDP